jgi:DNA-binding transcriptional ArsR family regulator
VLTIAAQRFTFNHMVEHHDARLNELFRALADPTRRAMLAHLAQGPRTVGELAAPYAISLAGASKHIQALERAGLVRREVQGRVHTCRLDAAPLHHGAEWIRHYERFWSGRLDALETLLHAGAAASTPQRARARKKAAAKTTAAKRSPRKRTPR